jgi:hypothetical protein
MRGHAGPFGDRRPSLKGEQMMDEAAAPAVRMACAAHWLDRSGGKPTQAVEIESQGKTLEQMLYEIWEAKHAAAPERAEGDQAG